jgi:hypothetical protein
LLKISLSFSSKIIFSAIFLPIHFTDSIVFLSSFTIASNKTFFHKESISKATFQPTPEIFISSSKISFSSLVKKP